jgi:hypothetical protein
MREGVGFALGWRWTVEEEAVLVVDTFLRWKKSDVWVPLVSERKGTEAYPFGMGLCWAEAEMGSGPKWLPRAFFLFSIFFSPFLFSDFRFVSYILHKCFKSIQTNFYIPQIFQAMFLTSSKLVFRNKR